VSAVLETLTEIALALTLGSLFIYASLPKLRRPKSFLLAVQAYELLPSRGAFVVALMLPPGELVLGTLFLTGAHVRIASILASLLISVFLCAAAIAILTGRDIDCGCTPGKSRPLGPHLLVEDALFLMASLVLFALQEISPATGWQPFSAFHNPTLLTGLIAAMYFLGLASQLRLLMSPVRQRVQRRQIEPAEHGGLRPLPEPSVRPRRETYEFLIQRARKSASPLLLPRLSCVN
jgi:hypothetical protein